MDDVILLIVLNLFPAYMGIHYAGLTKPWKKEGQTLTEDVRNSADFGMTLRSRRRLILFVWLFLWILINLVYVILQRGNGTVRAIGMMFIAFTLVFETLFLLQEESVIKQDQEINARLLGYQADYYERQYRAIAAYQDEARKQRHEWKNKSLLLLAMARRGACGEMIRLLEEDQQMKAADMPAVNTGNFTVDAVMNYEIGQAEKQNIEVKTTIAIPDEMDINGTVLCGILGNALDNAMEGCMRLEPDKRKIRIWMKVEKRNLMIEVRNSFDGVVSVRNGRLVSRKEDSENHGIGIRVMEDMIRRTNGTLETLWDNQWFTLRVVVYHVI